MIMDSFVNREVELKLIDEAFSALLNKDRLLRSPVIEFHGAGGIGKTTLLKKVAQRCNDEHIPTIWADASQSDSLFSRSIITQATGHGVTTETKPDDSNLFSLSVSVTRTLLKQGPVV